FDLFEVDLLWIETLPVSNIKKHCQHIVDDRRLRRSHYSISITIVRANY
uniref:Neur_chan_LBD domain-containing protein n=1 Tax=Ascaris lumbricoides TaxID=6252 RepID=A0A0M3IXU6_ASCLU